MSCKLLCIFALIFFGCCLANARVFYVDGPMNNPRGNYGYPVYPTEEESEQASRDLDLSFTAGEPTIPKYQDEREVVYPPRKVYTYTAPERPVVELSREYERSVPYYKIVDVPTRRIIYGDQYPVSEKSRKLVKLNNGPHKNEVVLELRVIANNNNDAP